MSDAVSLKCSLPFGYSLSSEQTNTALNVRIAIFACGLLATTIAVLVLSGTRVPYLSGLNKAYAWGLFTIGSGSSLLSVVLPIQGQESLASPISEVKSQSLDPSRIGFKNVITVTSALKQCRSVAIIGKEFMTLVNRQKSEHALELFDLNQLQKVRLNARNIKGAHIWKQSLIFADTTNVYSSVSEMQFRLLAVGTTEITSTHLFQDRLFIHLPDEFLVYNLEKCVLEGAIAKQQKGRFLETLKVAGDRVLFFCSNKENSEDSREVLEFKDASFRLLCTFSNFNSKASALKIEKQYVIGKGPQALAIYNLDTGEQRLCASQDFTIKKLRFFEIYQDTIVAAFQGSKGLAVWNFAGQFLGMKYESLGYPRRSFMQQGCLIVEYSSHPEESKAGLIGVHKDQTTRKLPLLMNEALIGTSENYLVIRQENPNPEEEHAIRLVADFWTFK